MEEKRIQDMALVNIRGQRQRQEELKKIALDFYEKCKSNNMTINEFNETIGFLQLHMQNNAVIRD